MKNRALSFCVMLGALAITTATVPVAAQMISPQTKFLKAVRDGKGSDAIDLINEGGSTLINAQDDGSGEGALHISVNKRSATWVRYLLQNGAKPDIADKKKVTPLMLATQLGYVEAVEALITHKAKVDAQNRSGETALVLAVHRNDPAVVKLLLKAGASPDKRDYTGTSAREYAQRDPRARAITDIFVNGVGEDAPVKPKQGDLDFSGIGDTPQ